MEQVTRTAKSREASARWRLSEKGREYMKRWSSENADHRKSQAARYYSSNRERIRERRKEYYWKHKQEYQLRGKNNHIINKGHDQKRARAGHLRRKYSITLEYYQKLYDDQIGVCAICNKRESKGSHLSVDHNHSTGSVRGLLCDNCNVGLGRFGDNPNVLRSAIQYLETHEVR